MAILSILRARLQLVVDYYGFFRRHTPVCKLPLKVSQSKVEVRRLDETRWALES